MADTQKIRRIDWYRIPLSPEELKAFNQRSDVKGLVMSLGFLGILVCTGGLSVYAVYHWHWLLAIACIYLHGTCFAFQINAVHELGHGTVFKTKWLNSLFFRVFGFLGWINFDHFDSSHTLHHRYTLHPPDDLEVTLPVTYTLKDFLKMAFIQPMWLYHTIEGQLRLARGKFEGKWGLHILPTEKVAQRQKVINWSRTVLIGHGLIALVSIAMG